MLLPSGGYELRHGDDPHDPLVCGVVAVRTYQRSLSSSPAKSNYSTSCCWLDLVPGATVQKQTGENIFALTVLYKVGYIKLCTVYMT
jgi:hypothetical protein